MPSGDASAAPPRSLADAAAAAPLSMPAAATPRAPVTTATAAIPLKNCESCMVAGMADVSAAWSL